MTRFRMGIVAFGLFLVVTSAFAQNKPKHYPRDNRGFFPPAELREELGLTEEQTTQIETLKQDFRAKMEEVRNSDFESQEDRKAAIKAVRSDIKGAFDEILTAEQKILLQEKREERAEQLKKKRKEFDREGLKNALDEYRSQHIQPTMLAYRQQFDAKIDIADQQTLKDLRIVLADLPAKRPMKGHRKAKRPNKNGEKERPTLSEDQKNSLQSLRSLTQKYANQIEEHLATLEDERQQWQDDLQEIADEYRPAPADKDNLAKGEGLRGNRNHRGRGKNGRIGEGGERGMWSKSHFLLMDPEQPGPSATGSSLEGNRLEVYPNPSFNANTVNYALVEAGRIKVELRREDGSLAEVLVEEYREPGSYNLNVDLSALNDGVYYVSLIDARGEVATRKIVVSK